MSNAFGAPDPSIALPAPTTVQHKPGPIHKLEFVIEVVGPRTIPSAQVLVLLQQQWQAALGSPQVWVMAPQDSVWMRLGASKAGSYDSLAFSWPYLGPSGNLSRQSAEVLLKSAEAYADQVQRRALPLPPPSDVDKVVKAILAARSSLDVGLSIGVAFSNPTTEENLWRALVALGLQFDDAGGFGWGKPPMLTVTPIEPPEQFSLHGAQTGRLHSGVSIGFSIPLSPDPVRSMEGCFKVADTLVGRIGGTIIDEEGDHLSAKARAEMGRNVQAAVKSLEATGLPPGSIEASTLFSA